MAEVRESTVRPLLGVTNGINVVFTTPTEFEAGSLRLIANGQVYEPDDDRWGWTETGSNEITLTRAPRAGDILQAFYRDLVGIPVAPVEIIKGSPFSPGECC